jgi:uncharacterized protein (TIGR02001 family)
MLRKVVAAQPLWPAWASFLMLGLLGVMRAAPALEFPALTPGGSLAATSDYIYRGVSDSDGHGAGQLDLHVTSASQTYLGVWASSRDHRFEPYADYDLEIYLGQRFTLNSLWSASVEVRSHYYLAGSQTHSDDYQQLSAAVSYLDRWTLSFSAIPNAEHYWYYIRLGRGLAFDADTSAQWLLGHGVYATFGAGYYYVCATSPLPPLPELPGYSYPDNVGAARGYAYGNLGLAYEHQAWRFDVGYFLVQREAQRLLPYPAARDRWAGTVSWHF